MESQARTDSTAVAVPKGTNIFKPDKQGTFRIEILPYDVKKGKDKPGGNPNAASGAYYWERTYYVHQGIGAEKKPYICLAKTMKKPCPICEFRNGLGSWNDMDDDTKEVAKSLNPKQRQLFNVWVHGQEDKGVQLWDVSYFLFGDALNNKIAAADPEDKEKYANFPDPEDGLTVKVGGIIDTMGKNKFWRASDIEFKDRKEAITDEMLEAVIDLDELIKPATYKELKALITQGESSDEDDDDEADTDDEEKDTEEDEDEDASDDDDEDSSDSDDDESEDEEDGDGDEDDESESEDDESEDEDEEVLLAKGDRVTYLSKKLGKRLKGRITSINHKNGMATVLVWKDKPAVAVPIDALTLVEDEEPPAKKSKRGEVPF